MKLDKDFVFIFYEDPCAVDPEIIASFESTSDAIRWSYNHRKQPEFRSMQWLSEQLGIRRQRLSRMLNQGDFKLDPSLVPMWDFLTGWTAVSQLIERRRDEIKQMRVDGIHKAIQEKVAA